MTLRTGNKRHTNRVRGFDLYETPAVATEALRRAECLPRIIWEPAAGRGAIVDVLREAGHSVVASDLVGYGREDIASGIDFLMERMPPPGVQAIVTNPPYLLANEFVRHGLKLCPLVIMLLRTAFQEGMGRSDILDGGKLARIHVFRNRLPMMHRDGFAGEKTGSAMSFAWFVWNRHHSGPTIFKRISWVFAAAGDARPLTSTGTEGEHHAA